MRHRCGTACFLTFLIFCLITFLAEIGLQVYLAVQLYTARLHVWFALVLGFLVAPWVACQLLSCQWLRTERGCRSQTLAILPHLLGLAVPWRYCRLLVSSLDAKQELSEICLLRLFLSFLSSLPIALVETYLLLNLSPDALPPQVVMYAALASSTVSVCWSIATHRKRPKDYHFLDTLISWPGTVFRIVWRICELVSRILVLALFAGLHSFWILLVLGLHWLTMFTWSLTEQVVNLPKGLTFDTFKNAVVSSYIYVFCYINMNQQKSRLRFMLFYTIMMVENTILMVLWFLFDSRIPLHVPMAIAIGSAHLLALVSCVLYYNCFHVKSAQVVQRGAEVMYMQPCVHCDPSCCNKDGRLSQNAFNTAWWIEVKENTDHNPNTYDMLLPSELGGRRSPTKRPLADESRDVRYIQTKTRKDASQSNPDDSSSPRYETLSKYEQALCCLDVSNPSNPQGNDGYVWDNYDLEGQCPRQGRNGECLAGQCQCQYGHPFQISDSGISASTSDHSHLPRPRSRSDASLFYGSDTSDMTSGMTSSSYVSYRRRGSYSDDWSLTTSSYGHTSLGSVRECPYLPMLLPLRETSGSKVRRPGGDDLNTSQGPSDPDIIYENSSKMFSQTLPANRARVTNQKHAYISSRRGSNKKAMIPCGVAARIKQAHLAAGTGSSPGCPSVVTSTTDSYDGSSTDRDWEDTDGPGSVQLTGTVSDLDFSVCGDDLCEGVLEESACVDPCGVKS